MVEHVVGALPGKGLARLLSFFFLPFDAFLPFSLLVFYIDRGLARGEGVLVEYQVVLKRKAKVEGGVFGSGWYVRTEDSSFAS